ncbi:MAG: hypothetical protein D3923_05585, partial [Candidatus Electrothrix sp. AR3]|nr:hypothetical protein [Candidatus Electrothrix sp. AR3]
MFFLFFLFSFLFLSFFVILHSEKRKCSIVNQQSNDNATHKVSMIKTGYSSIPEKLHLVIAGETGTAFSFVIRRDSLAALTGITLFVLLLFSAGSWLGVGFFQERNVLAVKLSELSGDFKHLQDHFSQNLEKRLSVQEASWQKKRAEYLAIISTLAEEKERLTSMFAEEKEQLICQFEEEIFSLTQASATRVTDLLAEIDREKQAKQNLIEKTARRLDERSQIIESLMSRIGVDVRVGKKKAANRGGPFMAASVDEKYSKQLLSRSDRYIRTIKKMPLG